MSLSSGATLRLSLRKLDSLSQKVGVKAQSADDDSDVDFSKMTPYRREQYLLVKELKILRENIAKLDAVEKQRNATATEKASVSLRVRKGMTAVKEKQQALKKLAQQDGPAATQEFQALGVHIDKTEKLYSNRFRGSGVPTAATETPGGSKTTDTTWLLKDRDPSPRNVEYMSLHDDEEFTMFFQTCKKNDIAMDRGLDRIMQGTSRMKETALQISQEITIQKRMLDEVEIKADRIHEEMQTLNGKLKKTLGEVDKDKMCLYLVCCVLLLGVAGYLLYESGYLPT